MKGRWAPGALGWRWRWPLLRVAMTERVREAFRPCIDLHDGAVKQIVGGTLQDSDAGAGMADGVVENFVSEKPPAFYSALCAPPPPARASPPPRAAATHPPALRADKEHSLRGGHVIKLGDGNEDAALEALGAWPGGLQIGGGITPENARRYLDAGASHTRSYIMFLTTITDAFADGVRQADFDSESG